MPLCEGLYKALCKRFKEVRISNEGEGFVAAYHSKDSQDGGPRHISVTIAKYGESYKICCPFCTDTRFRMSICHRWASYDTKAGRNLYYLIHCYNEDCHKKPGAGQYLERLVFGRSSEKRILDLIPAEKIITPRSFKAELPGPVRRLDQLPIDHRARYYLMSRNFDPDLLGKALDVSYCPEAKREYPLASNRIIIPIKMEGKLMGWQARYVGDKEDWKKARIPKYYNLSNMPKRSMLYNYDIAIKQNLVVICEGPMDAWRVGKPGVAIMGRTMSYQQKDLVIKHWRDGLVLIMLDKDAEPEAYAIHDQLKSLVRNVKVIKIEGTKDPGSMTEDEVWDTITSQLDDDSLEVINGVSYMV